MVGDHRAVAVGEEAVVVEAAAVAAVGAVMQGEKAQRNMTRVTSSASNAMAMGIMLTAVQDREGRGGASCKGRDGAISAVRGVGIV